MSARYSSHRRPIHSIEQPGQLHAGGIQHHGADRGAAQRPVVSQDAGTQQAPMVPHLRVSAAAVVRGLSLADLAVCAVAHAAHRAVRPLPEQRGPHRRSRLVHVVPGAVLVPELRLDRVDGHESLAQRQAPPSRRSEAVKPIVLARARVCGVARILANTTQLNSTQLNSTQLNSTRVDRISLASSLHGSLD